MFKQICIYSLFFSLGCHTPITPENKILILARRSDAPVGSRNNRSSMEYYWKKKLYKDTNSFDGRYSTQFNYFLIYIDKTNPSNWESYTKEDYGYSDTSNIVDSIRRKVYIDNADFSLLEQVH